MTLDTDRFAAQYWGSAPYLSKAADASRYDDLLTVAAVDELLSTRGLRTPFLRMAKDGQVLEAHRYTASGGAGAEIGDQVADDRVLALFADGATVVLQGLHRLWPPLVDFGTRLTADLGHPVQVNAYVTPPSSRGFSAHYDVHDVFVLQVAGRKRWVIHPPVHAAPLRSQPWTDHRAAVAEAATREPLIDTVLEPGDALYLPRGYLHSAEALGDVCVHLTVGVHVHTRYEIAEALCQLALSRLALGAGQQSEPAADGDSPRAALPLGVDVADPDAISADLAVVVDALADRLRQLTPADIAAVLADHAGRATRPAPLTPLAQAAAAAEVTSTTLVRRRPALRAALRDRGDRVALRLADREISLPGAIRPALTALLTGRDATPSDLPGLEADDGIVLVRRLLREGVVVPVH